MVNDFVERFKADSTLTDISVEKADTDHNVRKLTKLGNFLRNGERDKRTETSSGEDRF